MPKEAFELDLGNLIGF